MSFVALSQYGLKKVSLSLNPNEYRQPWECPQCHNTMVFVDTYIKRKHFRHLVDHGCESEPESEEHMEMKETLFHLLEKKGYECEYEIDVGGKVADICAIINASRLAIECQVSPVNIKDVIEKNDIYKRVGFEPRWILYPKEFLRECDMCHLLDGCNICHETGKECKQLRAVERKFGDTNWLFYYEPTNKLVERITFTIRWMEDWMGIFRAVATIEKRETVLE